MRYQHSFVFEKGIMMQWLTFTGAYLLCFSMSLTRWASWVGSQWPRTVTFTKMQLVACSKVLNDLIVSDAAGISTLVEPRWKEMCRAMNCAEMQWTASSAWVLWAYKSLYYFLNSHSILVCATRQLLACPGKPSENYWSYITYSKTKKKLYNRILLLGLLAFLESFPFILHLYNHYVGNTQHTLEICS